MAKKQLDKKQTDELKTGAFSGRTTRPQQQQQQLFPTLSVLQISISVGSSLLAGKSRWNGITLNVIKGHDMMLLGRIGTWRGGEGWGQGEGLWDWMVNEALAMIIEDTTMKHCKALLELEHEEFNLDGYGFKQSSALFKGLVSKISTTSFAFFCFLLA